MVLVWLLLLVVVEGQCACILAVLWPRVVANTMSDGCGMGLDCSSSLEVAADHLRA